MSRNVLSRLAVAGSLLLACSSAFASSKTNHAYFATRPQTYYTGVRQSAWFSQTSKENPGFGGNLQLAAFYQQSNDAKSLGNYFGFKDKRSFTIGDPAAGADIHAWNFNMSTGQRSTLSFKPESSTYGLRVDYRQDLHHLLEGLYFTVNAPIVRVTNDMKLREDLTATGDNWWNTARKFFAGGRLSSDWSESLKFAKIDGRRSATGLADLDLNLGYKFWNRDRSMMEGQLNLIVPTGNKPTGEYLFEPVVGNACHWGLGAGMTARLNVWQQEENEDQRLSLWLHARLDYLFENDEMRTLGLKGKDWGHFIRMRQENPQDPGMALANSLPGANVMTRRVNVTPGIQFNGMLFGDYTHNAWKIGLGYNLWAREGESLKLKGGWEAPGRFGLAANDKILSNAGGAGDTDNPRAQQTFVLQGTVVTSGLGGNIIDAAYDLAGDLTLPAILLRAPANQAISSSTTIANFANADGIAPRASGFGEWIKESDVDLSGHPAVVTHKLALSVAYALNTDNPSYLGAGGAYEFGSGNATMNNWMLWLNFGVSF